MQGDVARLERRIRELEASNAARESDVRFLAAMERVGRVSRQAKNLDELLEAVLDELLHLFKCDRAWLLYPCDPKAATWGVPKERTVAAWPGVFALGVQVPMDEGAASVFEEALESAHALPYDNTTHRQVPTEVGEAFSVKSQMVTAIRPHSGKDWLLGLHHCSEDHVWTPEELRIFEGVAERVADAVDALVLLRDLRQTETQIAEIEHAEAISTLASGVAHDFNNQLLVILCYAEMLGEQVGSPGTEYVGHVVGAAEQAANLTRQLLAFSRRAVLEPRPVDLANVARDNGTFLNRAVGSAVSVELKLSEDPVVATVDPAQVEQVLINLVMNARDAMPSGGTITVGAELRTVRSGLGPRDLEPGEYACLTVSDDGEGMDPATLSQVFEPFFTTKERGKGTGLGLSTAYGVARQSGGTMTGVSAPGEGTEFTLWLPQSPDAPLSSSGAHEAISGEEGCEAILLVEPEPEVAAVAAKILRRKGYRVTVAPDADQAMTMLQDVDLLLTEIALPGVDGVTLVERALREKPSLRATFCTGYSATVVERLVSSGATRKLLQKPFSPTALLTHVRYVLDR
jgi:two-component system, cell cycle sensor histidine kinase and response regulator CckA